MTNDFINKIRFQALIIFCSFPFAGFSQPDIPMSAELKSNSENWHVKIKQSGIWGTRPAMVSFGPLKTIETKAGKSIQISRSVDHELYWKNIHSESSRETSMAIVLSDTDTAEIRILTLEAETTRKRSLVGGFSKADPGMNENFHDSSWAVEMTIKFQNDSSIWHYIRLDSGKVYANLVMDDYGDSVTLFRTDNMEGKKMKEIMFSQPALGFVFVYQGKQVAAFQTILTHKAWISKSLSPKLKGVIMAATAALFATFKSENTNDF